MVVSILAAVLVVSSIAAVLAAVLVVSERFIANYGECEISINEQRRLSVHGGGNLLNMLIEDKIFIPSACGGRGTCGLCKLKVLEGAGPLLATEEPFLDKQEQDSNVRLSCQVKVRDNLKIEIAPELFAIREYTCLCAEIIELTADMRQFRFELTEPETIDYIAGQYVQLLTPIYAKSSEEVYRAYSMSGDPSDNRHIETIIRLVPGGICTTYCFEYLKVGDIVKVNGPYGDFRLSDSDVPVVFIAGGSGMAPIKCILHRMKNAGIRRKATFYFGVNTVADLFMVDLMGSFEAELEDFRFVAAVANPDGQWQGEAGLVTEVVRRDFRGAEESEAYLCGSAGMIDASIKVLMELGMSEEKIFYDKFE